MVNDSAAIGNMAANHSLFDNSLPPLPEYALTPRPNQFPYISDFWVSMISPIIVYWIMSMVFHLFDVYDLFPQYRLHTPEEITSRNHVSRYEVARDVIIQQIIQIVTGGLMSLTEPIETIGKADYDIAVWATRLRLAQRALPGLLGLVGLNSTALSKNIAGSHPFLAGALAGGYYPFLAESEVPSFAPWEMAGANFIYHIGIPAIQFFAAITFLDTWQYFLHRLMHINRWMYSKLTQLVQTFPRLLANNQQQPSTRATTASMSPMPTVPSTTTHSRASSWTPSVPALPSSSPE